jgi:rhodanese-related sulfurtransferase
MSGTISVLELRKHMTGPERWQLVDVRSSSEYGTGHIPGAINIPIEQIEARTGDLGGEPIALICKSGQRATMASTLLEPLGKRVAVLEGGTDAWKKGDFPIVASVRSRWSLERQVRLAAGLLVSAGVAAAILGDFRWIYLAGFVGVGLTFAGLTDFCPMGRLLGKLPWNAVSHRPVRGDAERESCCS